MKQICIRVIDSLDSRRDSICNEVRPFQKNSNEIGYQPSDEAAWSFSDRSTPNLFLIHLNDLRSNDGIPCCKKLEAILSNLPDALVVLYSGGGLEVLDSYGGSNLTVKQDHSIWKCNIKGFKNFCIPRFPISNASDLSVLQALENYLSTEDKELFFETIEGVNSNDIDVSLQAIAILCQGVLFANSNDKGEPAINKEDPAYEVCQDALTKMGISEFCTIADFERMRLRAYRYRQSLQTPSWWAQVFENKPIPISLTGLDEKTTMAIDKLINEVFYGDKIKSDSELVNMATIADLFLKLYKYLNH